MYLIFVSLNGKIWVLLLCFCMFVKEFMRNIYFSYWGKRKKNNFQTLRIFENYCCLQQNMHEHLFIYLFFPLSSIICLKSKRTKTIERNKFNATNTFQNILLVFLMKKKEKKKRTQQFNLPLRYLLFYFYCYWCCCCFYYY